MATLFVDVVSAEEGIFSGEASFVALPGQEGELGILPGHVPLITRIRPGAVRVKTNEGKEENIFVAGGILEVQPDRVTVLADTAIRSKDLDEAMKPYYKTVDGKKIAIVSASRAEKYKMTPQATESTPGILRCYDTELFIQTIKEAKENADYVIAVVHWGTEHTTVLEDVQRSTARDYIDAGADIIIGGHSHCLQGIEYYDDKPIFYSLGNFWFDEYNVDTMLVNIRISGDDDNEGKVELSVVPAVQDGTLSGCVTRICTEESDKSRIFGLLNEVSINANVDADGVVTQVK